MAEPPAKKQLVPDPDGLLRGGGNLVRFVPLDDERTLDERGVRALSKCRRPRR